MNPVALALAVATLRPAQAEAAWDFWAPGPGAIYIGKVNGQDGLIFQGSNGVCITDTGVNTV
jgi:hypothetical protein